MHSVYFRQPLAIICAIGFLATIKDIVTIHAYLLAVIDAFIYLVRPISDFLFGSFYYSLQLEYRDFIRSYVAVAIISFISIWLGIVVKYYYVNYIRFVIPSLLDALLWPLLWVRSFLNFAGVLSEKLYGLSTGTVVFFDAILWSGLLVGINYWLLNQSFI